MPAHIVNGEGKHLKMEGFPTFKDSWPWPWIGSYCIPSCIAHRPLPTRQISLKSKTLWTDGRMDGRTDIHLRQASLGRLWRVDLSRRVPGTYRYCNTNKTKSNRTIFKEGRTAILSPLAVVNGFVRPWPRLIHCSLDPHLSAPTPTTPWSVQTFVYTEVKSPIDFEWGRQPQTVPWAHIFSPPPKQHTDRFTRFCTTQHVTSVKIIAHLCYVCNTS